MREQFNLPVKSMQESKKGIIIAIVVIITALTGILMIVKNKESVIFTANLLSMNKKIESSTPLVTNYPDPVYDVSISVDKKLIKVMSSGTVADALCSAEIQLDDNDLINIGLSEKLNEFTSIQINRVEVMQEVYIEVIDYATEYKEDETLTLGHQEVIVDGVEGEVEKLVEHTYIDGELISSDIINEDVTEPVDEVVLMGTKKSNYIAEMSISKLDVPDDLVLDENGVPVSYSSVYTGKSCAYSAKPTAKTASGKQVKVGYVAVDPSLIPYGTELYIATTDNSAVYGYAIAADTGTALLDGRILVDLFMGSYEDSCDWGARQVNIYVLD